MCMRQSLKFYIYIRIYHACLHSSLPAVNHTIDCPLRTSHYGHPSHHLPPRPCLHPTYTPTLLFSSIPLTPLPPPTIYHLLIPHTCPPTRNLCIQSSKTTGRAPSTQCPVPSTYIPTYLASPLNFRTPCLPVTQPVLPFPSLSVYILTNHQGLNRTEY